MPQLPVPVPEIHDPPETHDPEIQDAPRAVAARQTETGAHEAASVDDHVEDRRERVPSSPGDRAAQLELGRAYLWSGDAERALETLSPLHRIRPSDREVQALILDALSMLDRTPDDHPWVEEPILVALDEDLLDRFHALLCRGRRPATVLDLCLAASEGGHPAFGAGELLEALREDDRFLVHPSDLAPECAVVVANLRRP